MIHHFGQFCSVDDDPGLDDGYSIFLAISDDGATAVIETTKDAIALAKFLIEWAEKVDGEK